MDNYILESVCMYVCKEMKAIFHFEISFSYLNSTHLIYVCMYVCVYVARLRALVSGTLAEGAPTLPTAATPARTAT